MAEKELQEIKERCEKASPGPWKVLNMLYNSVDEDAEFIAHAREDIPKLIAEIERLQALKQIGTCRECKWWERRGETFGICTCPRGLLYIVGQHFGCIHWAAKQE